MRTFVIIRAEEDASTAFITKSGYVIYKGDKVRTAKQKRL